MNLFEAEIAIAEFHRAHPETKRMSPQEVTDFVLTLPETEREKLLEVSRLIASEARRAVAILMARK